MRYFYLTFHKCGSQWVRDVLSDPLIVQESGVPVANTATGMLHQDIEWPKGYEGMLIGPLYNASYDDWVTNSAPEDKALVVLRDPRDIVVSWVHSVSFSHSGNPFVALIRKPLLELNPRSRFLIGLAILFFSKVALYSWIGRRSSERELITSYERLVGDPESEFARIIDFFGRKISNQTIAQVIEKHSFRIRSGRLPGQEETHSHFRKGIVGDWKNYLDQPLGELFENAFSGLLVAGGYEENTKWFEALTPFLKLDGDSSHSNTSIELTELRAQLVRCEEEKRMLEKICSERLQLIERLHAESQQYRKLPNR